MKNKKLYNIIFAAVLIISAAVILFVNSVDVRLYVGYVLIIASLIALLYSSISVMSKNIKKNLKYIIVFFAAIALVVLFYFISPSNDLPLSIYEKTNTPLGWSKIINAGMYLVYTLVGIVILSLIYSQVRHLLKK
jgi:dipeptide/tripeptide permease